MAQKVVSAAYGMVGFDAKMEYALLSALDLAAHYSGEKPVPVAEIAARTSTPRKYLVQILIQLKRAALVGSTRGPKGGYWLMRRPEMISLAEVMEALDSGATEPPPHAGDDRTRKALAQLALQLKTNRRQHLSNISLARFLKQVEGL